MRASSGSEKLLNPCPTTPRLDVPQTEMTVCSFIIDRLGLKYHVVRLATVASATQVRDQQVRCGLGRGYLQEGRATKFHVSHNLVAIGHLLLADSESTIRRCHEQARRIMYKTLNGPGLGQESDVILKHRGC